jgi:hypothetical protein
MKNDKEVCQECDNLGYYTVLNAYDSTYARNEFCNCEEGLVLAKSMEFSEERLNNEKY